jgi:hypothetical protein
MLWLQRQDPAVACSAGFPDESIHVEAHDSVSHTPLFAVFCTVKMCILVSEMSKPNHYLLNESCLWREFVRPAALG